MRADDRCATCAAALDPARHARCHVCMAGLCVHLVRDGVADPRYGVHQ